ncbi:MAG: hypothetical protein NVV70_06480 [Cellulomonas sp.]|nr:hypothetical protein [Cellulomonas sp.]MCR6647790.1 hypothetical protein [Cellulomonas sp.]
MTTKKPTRATTSKPIETPESNRDHVAAVSYRADGTPDQTTGFVVLVDEEKHTDPDEEKPTGLDGDTPQN